MLQWLIQKGGVDGVCITSISLGLCIIIITITVPIQVSMVWHRPAPEARHLTHLMPKDPEPGLSPRPLHPSLGSHKRLAPALSSHPPQTHLFQIPSTKLPSESNVQDHPLHHPSSSLLPYALCLFLRQNNHRDPQIHQSKHKRRCEVFEGFRLYKRKHGQGRRCDPEC